MQSLPSEHYCDTISTCCILGEVKQILYTLVNTDLLPFHCKFVRSFSCYYPVIQGSTVKAFQTERLWFSACLGTCLSKLPSTHSHSPNGVLEKLKCSVLSKMLSSEPLT